MLFRQPGESTWRPASTLNVSRTGVLFRAEGKLPDSSRAIEFIMTLPSFAPRVGARVRCTGAIARVAHEELVGGARAVGVTIEHYQFLAQPAG